MGGANIITRWNGLVGNITATTSDLPEGSNFYYTDARVKAVLVHIKDLFLQAGVSGSGSSGDPIVGWQSYINGSPAGSGWHMTDGIWDTTAELNPAASNVKIYGAGAGATIIRSHHSTALSAVVRFKAPSSADLFGVRLQGVTLDGNGLTPIGLVADNTLSSQFIDIEFRNATQWCFQGTRGIRNTYQDWLAWNSRMTTHTPNGFWFGVAGANAGVDNATTTSSMSLYAADLTGIGLKMTDDCFGNIVTGAVTGCATNLDIGQKTDVSKTAAYNNVFHADFEGAGSSAVNVAGEGHEFIGCNMPGANLTITGAGKHSFKRCYIANGAGSIDVSGATGDSEFVDCFAITASNFGALVNGTAAVLRIKGQTYTARKGVAVESTSSLTGEGSVKELFSVGDTLGYIAARGHYVYISANGSLVYSTVQMELEYGIRIDTSRNVLIGGILSGNGSGLTTLNASNLGSGTAPVARLPVLVASGASHAAGIAPDPGASAGTTKFLREDSTWQVPAGGGSVGGSDTQVLFNDSGTEAGDADLTWNKTTNALNIVAGKISLIESGSGGVVYLNSNHGYNYLDGSGEMFLGVYTRFACYDVFGNYIFVANQDGTYLRVGNSAPASFYSNSQCAAWIDETNNILNFKVKKSDASFVTFAVQPNGPVVLKDFIADVGNSGTSETDLQTYTTAANRLNANGEKLYFEFGFALAGAVTTTPELKVKFGGSTIFDLNTLAAGTNGKGAGWCLISRVSSTVIRYDIAVQINGISTQTVVVDELTGLTLSATNILKLTGQSTGTGAASNDIVAKLGYIEWKPAGA